MLQLSNSHQTTLTGWLNKYSGDYRHPSDKEKKLGYTYKKRVVPIKLETFRSIFNLDEKKDPRTGKTKRPGCATKESMTITKSRRNP